MANFAISNELGGTQQAVATAYKTLVNAYTGTATGRRGKVYDILVGTNGTPADNYMEWDISRFSATAVLAATTVTPSALDPADGAFGGQARANATAENTYYNNDNSSSVFYVGVNQRASYRWVAAPGSELVYPTTALTGLGLRTRSAAYTGTATGQLYVQEQ